MTKSGSNSAPRPRSPEDPKAELLQQIGELTKNARTTFFVMQVACLYSLLTIGTTSDVAIIANSAVFPLPVVGTLVPVVWFYGVAPFLLLCVYVYFHLYLQRLWRGLASLPPVLVDGRPVDEYVYPWIISNALLRAKVSPLKAARQRFSRLEWLLSVALGWCLVPLTIAAFWLRYLTRHDRLLTGLQVLLVAFSAAAAVILYRNAVSTLQGREPKSALTGGVESLRLFRGFAVIMLVTASLLAYLSIGAIRGAPSGRTTGSMRLLHSGVRLLEWIWISPFAELEERAISKKHPGWTGEGGDLDRQIKLVEGASLRDINLRYARASNAFMVAANLHGADLRWAVLSGAQLQGAVLERAKLQQAHLNGARLEMATLKGAHLDRADLDHAILQSAEIEDSHFPEAIATHAVLCKSIGRGADFTGADLRFSNLADADMEDARFNDASLQKAILDDASLDGATFHGARLQSAKFRSASLVKAEFPKARLYDASLAGADLYRARFEGANLDEATLRGGIAEYAVFESAVLTQGDLEEMDLRFASFQKADLSKANLRNADLRKADFSNATLVQADLTAAILTDASFHGANLRGADLTDTVGLTSSQLEEACGDARTRLPVRVSVKRCDDDDSP